jgi:hypothetical protein
MFPFGGVSTASDGNIVVAGQCVSGGGVEQDSCVARVLSTGTLDSDFSGDGLVVQSNATGMNYDMYWGHIQQPDGKIVGVGPCQFNTPAFDLCVDRFTTTGGLDNTFATGGKLRHDEIADPSDEAGTSVVMGIDGAVVIGGLCAPSFGAGPDLCAFRLSSSGTVEQYADTVNDWDTGTSFIAACLRSLGGGALNDWDTNGSCPASDAPEWNPISASMTKVAHTTAGAPNGTATLNFGVKMSATQPDGRYVAPITLDVIAPNL